MNNQDTGKSGKPAKTEAPPDDSLLLDANWRLESIIEATHVGIWEWNVQTGETVFNEVWAEIVGYTLEELAPISITTWETLAHPDDLEQARDLQEQHFAGKLPYYDFEIRMKHKDGHWVWVHSRGRVITRTEDGKPLMMFGTHTDITERKKGEKALRESEDRFRNLFEQAPLGYQSLDAEGNFLELNETWCTLLGYKKEEVLGRNFSEFIHPDFREHFRENFPKFKGLGYILGVEFEMIRKDGSEILVSFDGRIGLRDDGSFKQTHCVLKDITDRQRAEEALRGSEVRHGAMVANISDVIAIIGVDGVIKYKSPNIEKLFGWKPEELVGTDGWATVHPDDLARIQMEFGLVLSGDGSPRTVEYRYKCRDGSYKPIELTAVDLTKDPVIGGVLMNYQDITERKRAEAALRESERRFRGLFENLLNGFALHEIVVDDAGRPVDYIFLEINEEFGKQTGLVREAVIGRRVTEVMPGIENDPADWIGTYGKVALGGEKLRFEQFAEPLGKWFQVTAYTPEINQFATVFEDITESKQAEEDRQVLQLQLNQAQKMESVGRLAGGVAHDFNNMLGVIMGHADLAMDGLDPSDPLFTSLREIEQAGQRSADLTGQLLAFARQQPVTPKVLDLNDTAGGMLSMLQRLIGENLDLVWMPGAGLWQVKVDPSQIDQLLANLCVNARDAISGLGRITIETENVTFDEASCADHPELQVGDFVMLAVSDNGSGMDDETLEHIFEPFYTTKGVGEGTGLGLATVYGIVKQNDGFVSVYSEVGGGTTFKIYLPRHVGEAEEATGSQPDLRPRSRGETVLMVEDEGVILMMGREMLEKLGYTVLTAGTPGEALRKAEDHAGEIHLLITDVVMPEMNGRELASRIVALRPDLKVLFMSGYTANVIAPRGVLDEGIQFLQKPFGLSGLAVKVREVLGDN